MIIRKKRQKPIRCSVKIAVMAVTGMLLAAGQVRAEEKKPNKIDRRPDELYMLNYNKFIQYGYYFTAGARAAQFRGGCCCLLRSYRAKTSSPWSLR